jgi:hypothetical protein
MAIIQQWTEQYSWKFLAKSEFSLFWYSAYYSETTDWDNPIWDVTLHTYSSVDTNVSVAVVAIRIEGELPSLQECKRRLFKQVQVQMFGEPKLWSALNHPREGGFYNTAKDNRGFWATRIELDHDESGNNRLTIESKENGVIFQTSLQDGGCWNGHNVSSPTVDEALEFLETQGFPL